MDALIGFQRKSLGLHDVRRKKVVVDPAQKQANAAKEAEEEELAKLVEMKDNLGDSLPSFYSDSDLLSFLRARSLNVKEAEKLLSLDANVKKFLRVFEYQPPEAGSNYNFSSVIGFDKEGCLVRIINIGGADTKGVINVMSTIEALKVLIYMLGHDAKLQDAENRKSGRKCKHFVYVLNLENLHMGQVSYKPAFDTAMQILKLLQDHFHDVLKKICFVNAPSFFSSVFKLFKPVIQDSLQQKINIFDHENTKAELLKLIDADVLPQYLGGNLVDSNGDPYCKEFIQYGEVVPESLYVSNFLDADDPDVVVATVPAGASLNFRFPVRQVGSIFHYHIQGKDNDLGFGLYLEPFSSSTETPRSRRKNKEEDLSRCEQLTPIIRSQCHICPEEGQAIAWFTGNIIMHFDNTYSWMNSKEVLFKIWVSPPTDVEKNFLNTIDQTARGFSQMNLSQ